MMLRVLILVLSAGCGFGATTEMRFAPPASSLLKTDVMFVGAHPDDETGTSATLARYALKEGKSVACIYCTRGEGGGNMVGRQSGAALGILREAELRNSLDILGIRHVYFLDQLDWAYTESFAATLRKWNHEETLSRLVRYIRALKPEVIITMNPAPSPGQHGHHQAAGVLATEAFAAAADPTRFPDQITHEFLETWKVRKLYYGGSGEYTAKIATDVLVRGDKTAAQVAGEAAAQHRSQGFGGFSSGGRPGRPQSFVLARTRVKPRQNETDLLAGLDQPVSGEEILISSPGSDTTELEVSFVPRPALTYYREWAASNAVTHMSANFSADIPVVASEWNPIALTVWNHAAHEMDELLAIGLPPNWKAKGIPDRVVLRAGSTKTIRFLVQPASDARLDSGIDAHVGNRLKPINAHALLHPVPLTVAHRLKKLGVLSQLTERLRSVPFVQITTNLIVQGSVTSTNDSSGGFKIGYDSDFLYVQTDVRDDHIISNIAPDDIKGHWRSDSIEICIDKGAAAEDTLNSFKLGVFPFDSSGRVRAARDADANQGLVEETSPRTRLLSFKTEGGYRILAGIPLNDIGVKARKGTALRFNIIIYDGDKATAVPGENINKSRLAWAPRAGVQGRPEDWGRLVFE